MKQRQKRRFVPIPQDHTVLVRQTSAWTQIFLMSLVGVGTTILATSWFYRIDEVITAKGMLVPQSGGVEIKSPSSGKLKEILVKNGDKVKKGEIVVVFNVEQEKAEYEALNKQLALETDKIEDQVRSNAQRQDTTKRNIEFTKKLISRLEPLQETGAISEIQILQQKTQLEGQNDELIRLRIEQEELINSSESRIAEIKKIFK